MATCNKCKKEISEDAAFCQFCGENVKKSETSGDFTDKFSDLNNTADTTCEFDKDDIEQNKIMGVLAYLSWLVIIPIIAVPNSKFAKYHSNQGLVLAIAELLCGISVSIVSLVLSLIRLSFVASLISTVVNIIFLIFTVLGIVNVVNGRAKELPVIGGIRILK